MEQGSDRMLEFVTGNPEITIVRSVYRPANSRSCFRKPGFRRANEVAGRYSSTTQRSYGLLHFLFPANLLLADTPSKSSRWRRYPSTRRNGKMFALPVSLR